MILALQCLDELVERFQTKIYLEVCNYFKDACYDYVNARCIIEVYSG